MSEAPDQELLHYRLIEKIGEGGMGVVWRAVDTTLDRDVAIKILPDLFSEDPERLARFEREAKLLASLNHPNIAGIYGIHEVPATGPGQPGVRFLAMELIEGEDLAERLARGALPTDEALTTALAIAQGLEAAHESGVIHRDLKPANIKLSPGGNVKVLDFGLAKAFGPGPAGDGASPSMSPTMTSAGTVAGLILGTASYMSPEQAKGKEVDRRADIWSFGVVLFELLTGRRLFEGESISETLASVILRAVDFDALPAGTPPAIRRLLQRCLQRDPQSRLRDIGDARIALQEALQAPAESKIVPSSAPARSSWPSRVPWILCALLLAALAIVWLGNETPVDRLPVMRFAMEFPEDRALATDALPVLALSADGTKLVYVGQEENDTRLFLRQIHLQETTPLDGTEGAASPFFSPDGQSVAFVQEGKLRRISVMGGPPNTLCDAPQMRGASWGSNGTIVFAPDRATGLMRIPDSGGRPEPLTTLEFDEASFITPSHRWPELLPGGNAVLFTSTANDSDYDDAEIVALSLADRKQKTIVKGGTFPRYVKNGFLLYTRAGTLFAARFDPVELELTGPAVPVVEQIAGAPFFGSSQLTFSDTGLLVYVSNSSVSSSESLIWIDRDGKETPASERLGIFGRTVISPDGKQAAIEVIENRRTNIWLLEFGRDSWRRLTFGEQLDRDPIWSPDGKWIVFNSLRDGASLNLFRKRANGTGEVERLTSSPSHQYPTSWSPDGKLLAFHEDSPGTNSDLMFMRPDEADSVEVFLRTPFNEGRPAISPDGKWIAYRSDESGSSEVYVRPLTGDSGQVRISANGGYSAMWSADGKELLYVNDDDKLMAVACSVIGQDLRPGAPVALFNYLKTYGSPALHGQRILTDKDVMGDRGEVPTPTVVVNWFDELAEKAPRR